MVDTVHGNDSPSRSETAHGNVKRELLVRYLDAWTPAALHGHKRITYVHACADSEAGGALALAALRVFGEFADRLEHHTLTVLLVGSNGATMDATTEHLAEVAAEYGSPDGLTVHSVAGLDSLPLTLKRTKAMGSPIFGYFDGYGPAAGPVGAVSTVGGSKGSEILLAGPAAVAARAYHDALAHAGLTQTCRVELVDRAGRAELLVFGSASQRALEKFKDELWALDDYAGIRLRDPADEERSLLDISVAPHLGPLRRALVARVGVTGGATLAELRAWAVHETVFRASDATRAVQALVAAGAVSRLPAHGRLSPDTRIMPAGAPAGAPVGAPVES